MKRTLLSLATLSLLSIEGCSDVSSESTVNDGLVATELPLETETGAIDGARLTQDDLPLKLTDGHTVCGFKDRVVFGSQRTRFLESYHFERLNAALGRNESVQRHLAFKAVEDCEEARQYVIALNEHGGSDLESESTEDTDTGIEGGHDKIHIGESVSQTTGQRPQEGIVQLSNLGCTGFFITGRHILTAAHCVPQDGPRSLSYQAPTLSARTETFVMQRHPDYQEGDRSTDVAILTRNSGSLSWASSHKFRLYTGTTRTGTDLHIYGYGAKYYDGSGAIVGDLRTGRGFTAINLNYHESGYFRAYAHTARTCAGDSGGPAVRQLSSTGTNDQFAVVWGVYHGRKNDHDDACAHEDEWMLWAKTSTNITWIETMIGRCARFNNSDGPYASCG